METLQRTMKRGRRDISVPVGSKHGLRRSKTTRLPQSEEHKLAPLHVAPGVEPMDV